MIDLHFAEEKTLKLYRCESCPKLRKLEMKCAEPGYDNLKRPRAFAPNSGAGSYTFCPGKATWSEEIAALYTRCQLAAETGVMPEPGELGDQHWVFDDVFPMFLMKYNQMKYLRVWKDVYEFTPKVLEQIGKMIAAMFGKKK